MIASLVVFFGIELCAVLADRKQQGCTPITMPLLHMKGFCLDTDNLVELCASNQLEMSLSNDCLQFDGAWCCYNPLVSSTDNASDDTKAQITKIFEPPNDDVSPVSLTTEASSVGENIISADDFNSRAISLATNNRIGSSAVSGYSQLGYMLSTLTSTNQVMPASAPILRYPQPLPIQPTQPPYFKPTQPSFTPAPVYSSPQPITQAPYNPPKSVYSVPIPAVVQPTPYTPQPTYSTPVVSTLQKLQYSPPTSSYSAVLTPQPAFYSQPQPSYTTPKSVISAAPPQAVYTHPPSTYSALMPRPQPAYAVPTPSVYSSPSYSSAKPAYSTTAPVYYQSSSGTATQRRCGATDMLFLFNQGLCIVSEGRLFCVPNGTCAPF